MSEVQPPAFAQAAEYDALAFRRAITAGVRLPGIIATGDLAVVARSPAAQGVNVLAGAAMVPGTQVTRQGFYHVVSTGTVAVNLAPANSTNPRLDLIVARVRDAEYGGSVNSWTLEAVTGTPAANPSTPTLPPNSYALAEVTVPAGSSSVTSARISNRRAFASFSSDRYSVTVPHRSAGVVGTPPNTLYGFLTVAGTAIITTNGAGEATIPYPSPANDVDLAELFPSGVATVVASPGTASPAFSVNVNHGGHTRTSFAVRCYKPDGTRLSGETVRVNYVAVGW